MSKNQTPWKVLSFPGNENVFCLLCFLMQEYERIFGSQVMCAEPCAVFNEPNAPCPMLITNTDPIMIRLAQSSTNYWAQTVFQLSHEMCHYVIRQGKINKEYTIKWIEEIICEAMSLYALQYCVENWNKCVLYNSNSTFSYCFNRYLAGELKKECSDVFASCQSIDQLRYFNENADENEKREDHRAERNRLYYAISAKPEDCRCFLEFYQYKNEDMLTIDFESWKKRNNTNIIQVLEQIQPNIEPTN